MIPPNLGQHIYLTDLNKISPHFNFLIKVRSKALDESAQINLFHNLLK